MIIAFVECTGTISAEATEVLTVVRALADRTGAAAGVVAVGAPGDLPAQLAEHSITRLDLLRHPLLDPYSPELWGDALAQVVAGVRPDAVLAARTERAAEVMARAAARQGVPLAADCIQVRPGEPWEVTRERAGGSLLEDAELDAAVRMCTLVPSAGPIGSVVGLRGTVTAADVVVREFVPDLDAAAPHATLVARHEHAAGLSLATAPVVVSGGRGVGSAEGYRVLEELAGLVGGAVGCSRVATNNGWRPHRDQVGLTGTRIHPDLYIACGISGATQHWVGCMGAKTILAINTDAEAPMVTRGTYAVIGDVHEVLPAVIEEIRRRTGGRVAMAGRREPVPVPGEDRCRGHPGADRELGVRSTPGSSSAAR